MLLTNARLNSMAKITIYTFEKMIIIDSKTRRLDVGGEILTTALQVQ